MASKKNLKDSAVFDEMIEFLSEPVFQIPIRSFMDENCLIFDIDSEPLKEHRIVFAQYKQLVDDLLEAFCEDVNLTPEQAVQGVSRLNKIPDLHDMFSGLFEQVLAANDFSIFYTAMAKHNILVQEQVIAMILATTGIIPLSLIRGMPHGPRSPVSSNATAEAPSSVDRHEAQLLNMVIENSKSRESTDVKKMLDDKNVKMSQEEAKSLERERLNIEKQMKRLVIEAEVASPPRDSTSEKAPGDKESANDLASAKEASLTGERTVNHSEQPPTESNAYSTFAASLSKLTPEEIKQRQEFLRQQRDKLIAMKKEAREKQLKDAERMKSARPSSARAARSALTQKPVTPAAQPAVKPEDERKMAMRRAIAEKLRQEVIKQ